MGSQETIEIDLKTNAASTVPRQVALATVERLSVVAVYGGKTASAEMLNVTGGLETPVLPPIDSSSKLSIFANNRSRLANR